MWWFREPDYVNLTKSLKKDLPGIYLILNNAQVTLVKWFVSWVRYRDYAAYNKKNMKKKKKSLFSTANRSSEGSPKAAQPADPWYRAVPATGCGSETRICYTEELNNVWDLARNSSAELLKYDQRPLSVW